MLASPRVSTSEPVSLAISATAFLTISVCVSATRFIPIIVHLTNRGRKGNGNAHEQGDQQCDFHDGDVGIET